MEKVIQALIESIREEALKPELDLPRLKSLITLALEIRSMLGDSLSEVSTPSVSGLRPAGVPVGIGPAVYAPSITERLIGNVIPGLIPLFEDNFRVNKINAIARLAENIKSLKEVDPALTSRLTAAVNNLLDEEEKKKEKANADLST